MSGSEPIPLFQVDAFTDRPFAGNPAAVCILRAARDEPWMQDVAREMNLSETAFVSPRVNGSQADGYELRWFTPAVEVDLCGHATLASAHILWETGRLPPDTLARFQTRSGLLTAARQGDRIQLDFPAAPASEAGAPPGLLEALGIAPRYVGRTTLGDWLIEAADAAAVRGLAPDMGRLREVPARGVIVTAPGDSGSGVSGSHRHDFISRFFAPRCGIDEDPVTGSAHCTLGPFWVSRLGKDDLVGYQASARGGIVGVRVAGERVLLSGRAVTVLRGELIAG